MFVAFLVGSKSDWQLKEQPGPRRSDTDEGSKGGGDE